MSQPKQHPRIPFEVGGIQVNHCKTPTCPNFGIPAAQAPEGRVNASQDPYRVIGGRRSLRQLTCHFCQRSSALRSNLAIAQEVIRLDPHRLRAARTSCATPLCAAFGMSVDEHPERYQKYGRTAAGEPRYRCKGCGSTLTGGSPLRTQRRPEVNVDVLKLVVNKVPMRRICEVLDLNPATLYSKLGYLAAVASDFSAKHERRIAAGEVPLNRAYISVDRQDHVLNWGSQLDRRYTTLGAVGAAENESGYVLAMQLNFDPDCNPEDVEADAIARGDYLVPPVHRHYARLWLRRDYQDIDAPEENEATLPADLKAPNGGMQVKLEVLYFALMVHLRKMLQTVERVRLFVDRDPALDTACLAAFCEEILARRCDVFLVKTGKDLSVDKKKLLIAQVSRDLDRYAARANVPERESVRLHYVVDQLRHHRAKNPAGWFEYPLSDMADPSKELLYLTDFGDLELEHLARLTMRASLRGIDKFFMQVRRRLSVLERPLQTRNNAQRGWHGYSAYSPLVVQQLLHIFRAYYNYSLPGQDGRTPAMRLGLTDQAVALEMLSSLPPRGIK
ncbi:hypothetical protein [Curvibacter delicatus]|uniref:hypothetical protein n=1 Tax=Curvibacter delicatus TaxID=80879 RepID=UPI0012EE9322|nr:hypothetical protein [Curvibacter delicatus]